ncbi:conserved exported hypothetical protein [Flavobacterium sp. 9AF]|uniref:hypothetical protein n=1 Tax=Flavobacterium sp. 9AF TaxID=2653142 RepID=UPI0012F25A7A|nr:hypothetical protein [Flavobacterium sp. 9AF]VXC36308.1 conserved exported hypothetical protein [Flavobacterium sp. 9AF]
MKKVLLSVFAVCGFLVANAQEEENLVNPIVSSKGEHYLPQMDDWAISFNADGIFEYVGNAFSGSTSKNYAPKVGYVRTNTFVGKMFISDKKAYRVVANLGFGTQNNTNPITTGPNAGTTLETSNNDFALAAGLGKEWRKGNTRLQGFYGADVLLTTAFSNEKNTTTDTQTGDFISSVEEKSGLDLGVGVQGFIGAEYFIFPKFAIGAQYTYRVGLALNGASETTTKLGTADAETVEGDKSFSFAFGDLDNTTNVGVGVFSLNLTLHF